MLTQTAAGTVFRNHRIGSVFQVHGPPFYRAAFITGTAEQMAGPGIAFFPIQLGKAHAHFFNGHIMQGIRWTDFAAAHTEMAGSLLGIDLRRAGNKKIETAPHLDTVEYADLGALTALKTPGKKFLFSTRTRWAEKTSSKPH
jgi:hypothetical protein